MRSLLTPAILRVLVRGMRWPPLVAAAAVANLVVIGMKNSSDGYDMVAATRLTVAFIAIGAASLLDDPAAVVTAPSPSSLSFRRGTRLAFGAGVIALVWLASVWHITATPRAMWGGSIGAIDFPMLRFSTELVALTLAGLSIALIAGRLTGEDRGALAAAPGLLAALIVLARLPHRWAMLTAPGGERWADSGRDWIFAVAALLAIVAALSIDPARRRLWTRRSAL